MCPRLLSFVLLTPLRAPALTRSTVCYRRRVLRWCAPKNKCPLCGRLFFLRAHHIITYLYPFFDIFHGLKKIAKKDKPGTGLAAALPRLVLPILYFSISLISLLPVKKLLSPPSKAFFLKKRHFCRCCFLLSTFLERTNVFI